MLVEGKSKSILVSLVSKFSNINFNMATVKSGRPGDPVRQFFQKLDGTVSIFTIVVLLLVI